MALKFAEVIKSLNCAHGIEDSQHLKENEDNMLDDVENGDSYGASNFPFNPKHFEVSDEEVLDRTEYDVDMVVENLAYKKALIASQGNDCVNSGNKSAEPNNE